MSTLKDRYQIRHAISSHDPNFKDGKTPTTTPPAAPAGTPAPEPTATPPDVSTFQGRFKKRLLSDLATEAQAVRIVIEAFRKTWRERSAETWWKGPDAIIRLEAEIPTATPERRRAIEGEILRLNNLTDASRSVAGSDISQAFTKILEPLSQFAAAAKRRLDAYVAEFATLEHEVLFTLGIDPLRGPMRVAVATVAGALDEQVAFVKEESNSANPRTRPPRGESLAGWFTENYAA